MPRLPPIEAAVVAVDSGATELEAEAQTEAETQEQAEAEGRHRDRAARLCRGRRRRRDDILGRTAARRVDPDGPSPTQSPILARIPSSMARARRRQAGHETAQGDVCRRRSGRHGAEGCTGGPAGIVIRHRSAMAGRVRTTLFTRG